jgi:hypothetical protein
MSLSILWRNVKTPFRRYTWVGNRISPDAMAEMYRIRQATGKPITRQVADAVDLYLKAERRQ